MHGLRGMFTKIPGTPLEDSENVEVEENVEEDFGECSTRLQRMLTKIPGNVQQDSGEFLRRYCLYCRLLFFL